MQPFRIGDVSLGGNIILAPMAGKHRQLFVELYSVRDLWILLPPTGGQPWHEQHLSLLSGGGPVRGAIRLLFGRYNHHSTKPANRVYSLRLGVDRQQQRSGISERLSGRDHLPTLARRHTGNLRHKPRVKLPV